VARRVHTESVKRHWESAVLIGILFAVSSVLMSWQDLVDSASIWVFVFILIGCLGVGLGAVWQQRSAGTARKRKHPEPTRRTIPSGPTEPPAPPAGAGLFPLADADPRRVGGYDILAVIGEGSMGRVYLGRSAGGRAVAVKVINASLAGEPGYRRRFAREIDALRRVAGSNVVELIDADPNAPSPWLVTAYVSGPSLHWLIEEHGAWGGSESAWRLAAGIAEALRSIHSAGLVHRDVKPGNVLLAQDGVRLIDFGIAHTADASQLTRLGDRPGTRAFMAPEQVAGRSVSPATDVFSLAGTVFFAITGRPPFGDGEAVLHRIETHEPDLTGVEDGLRDLISACLEKDPAARPSIEDILARCEPAIRTAAPMPSWLPKPAQSEIAQRTLEVGALVDPGRGWRRAKDTALLAVGIAAVLLSLTVQAIRLPPWSDRTPPSIATGPSSAAPTPSSGEPGPSSVPSPAPGPPGPSGASVAGSGGGSGSGGGGGTRTAGPPTTAAAANPPASPAAPPTTGDGHSERQNQIVNLDIDPGGHDTVFIDDWQKVVNDSGDLRMDANGLTTVRGAALAIIPDSPDANWTRCSQVTQWVTAVPFTSLREGSQMCGRSQLGRYASLRVTAMPTSTYYHFIFHGIVWEPVGKR